MKKVSTVIKVLNKKFPKISGVRDASEWSGEYKENSAIHLGDAGEGGEVDNDYAACDYYTNSDFYEFGVHEDLAKFMGDNGFYVECYDPGTYIAFRT